MLNSRRVIFSFALAAGLVTAATFSLAAKKPGKDLELIKEVIGRYQEPEAVKAKVKKEVFLALLEEKKSSEGSMTFSKGRLRLEIQKPEESLIVMNKDVIWVVTPTPKELGGKTQVLKIISKDMAKQSKAPLAVLLAQKKAWDQFVVKKTTEKDGKKTIKLEPVDKETMSEVASVELVIDNEEKLLSVLSYKDDLDNETKFTFTETDLAAKATDKAFSYKPPKDAEVTEYK